MNITITKNIVLNLGLDASRTLMKSSSSLALSLFSAVIILTMTGCSADSNNEETVATEVSVQVAKVKRVSLHAYIEAYGVVEPEPAGNNKPAGAVKLAAPIAGIVMSVPVKEGQQVVAGTVIVKLDDRAALAAVDKAKHVLELATQVMERQNKLKIIEGTSDKAVQEAAQQLSAAHAELVTAQAQLAQVQLATPLTGIVSHINVQPGQAVDINTMVAEVVNPNLLVITANVAATEASVLKVGQRAEIFADSSDHALATTKVLFISPVVDAQTGAVLVRVAAPSNLGLRSGEAVRTRIVSEERTNVLAVPIESVVTDSDGHSVVAIVNGDSATQTPIQTGLRDDHLIEIQAVGLKEGDTVVTVGAYGLPLQSKIRVLNP